MDKNVSPAFIADKRVGKSGCPRDLHAHILSCNSGVNEELCSCTSPSIVGCEE
jgi:hypothetical protein